jgi:ABC-type transport system substrate-binding protein
MLQFLAGGGVEVRWHLREGLRWSDGHALTSDDFRFALEVSPDEHIERIETPDARTLVLVYDDVLAQALEGLSPLPRHQLREEARRDAGFEAVREAQRSRVLASAGPYALKSFELDRLAVAEANPHYIGPAPAIRRVEVRAFADSAALSAAFRAHAIDIILPNTLSGSDLSALQAEMPDAVIERASEDLVALTPDLSIPMLTKRDVRRAILMAIDRQTIEHETGGRSGVIAMTPIRGQVVSELDASPYDPVRARAVLEAEHVVGSALVISHASRRVDATIAEKIAEQLRAVGFVVTLQEMAQGQQSRARGGFALSTLRNEEDSDLRRYWNLPRVNGRFVDAERNAVYDDGQADLTNRFMHALYAERRHQLRQRNALAVARNLPVLPLFFATERIVAAPELDGWEGGTRFGELIASWHFTAHN